MGLEIDPGGGIETMRLDTHHSLRNYWFHRPILLLSLVLAVIGEQEESVA